MNKNCSQFFLGPLAQLVRALPCHGRGRRFKSVMDRQAPSKLRGQKVCYDSHKNPLEILDNVSRILYNSTHDQRTSIK
jgi:hypothetical protein